VPACTVSRHGLAMSRPTLKPKSRGKRGLCTGWSASASRRNTRFLWSIREDQLPSLGIAFTGTIRDCPPHPDLWKALREAFFVRLRRSGLKLAHWVTEWQLRGCPHLHCALYFDAPRESLQAITHQVLRHWLEVSASYGSLTHSQHLAAITDSVGWSQYTAKHASRGAAHYQRSDACIPSAWKGRSVGRVWGHLGDWPTIDPVRYTLDEASFFKLRRILKGYRLSQARNERDPKKRARRITSARRSLKSPDSQKSRLRGQSEWISARTSERVLDLFDSGVLGAEVLQT
jgi:hypothetical protein